MTKPIPVRNVYYLYAYAWDQFHVASRVDAGNEFGPDAFAFFAKVLIHGCHRLFQRGIGRDYLTYDEEQSTVRGRIDIAKTVRRESLRRGKVWCEFSQLEYDILQNQILKATFLRFLRLGQLPKELCSDVRDILRAFNSLNVRDIKVSRHAFQRIQLHRNNSFYRFLLHVCELVWRRLFPNQEGDTGSFFAGLSDEAHMARLFEKFVRNFLREEQTQFRVTSEKIAWDIGGDQPSRIDLLPGMQTDTVLRSEDRTIVIDTKYYAEALHTHHERKMLRSAHLYQLFSYLKNLELKGGPDTNADGLLLYPLVTEDVQFSATLQGHRVSARTLDLTLPWPDLRRQLLSYAPPARSERYLPIAVS